jgi:predicted enzyme related to lactoylglutathione lyase
MFRDTEAFASFAVDDIDKAREFYGETLGVQVEEYEEGLLALHHPGGRDTMVYAKPDYAPATYTVLNFAVEDVEAAVDALGDRGVTLERYEGIEQDERGISHGMGPDIAWFKDPAGNVLSVLRKPS